MTIEIRHVAAVDYEEWRALWDQYLAFYNTVLPQERTLGTWSRFLDQDQPMGCFLARESSKAVGFVTYVYHLSTWLSVGDCYLEDLFVAADVRGGGVGGKLIQNVRTMALDRGCERLYWFTENDNRRARGLYDKVTGGADPYVRYRLTLTPPT